MFCDPKKIKITPTIVITCLAIILIFHQDICVLFFWHNYSHSAQIMNLAPEMI